LTSMDLYGKFCTYLTSIYIIGSGKSAGQPLACDVVKSVLNSIIGQAKSQVINIIMIVVKAEVRDICHCCVSLL
jgi:hypothetical protein